MCLEVKQNILGGQSLWVSPGANLSNVPSPYRELLRPEHREAFTNTTAYFGHLAELCDLSGMKQWFAEMGKAGRCGLQVHVDMYGNDQQDVLVRGLLPNRHSYSDFRIQTFLGGSPRISRLPNVLGMVSDMLQRSSGRRQVSRLPAPLRMVYELIDGTVESGFGGINSIGDLYLDYIASQIPLEKGTPPDLLNSPIFYGYGSGDTLVACNGKAYWYLHEICGFREAGELFDVVSGYFDAMLEGRDWLSNPYANL
jgi:hypothetical protein